MALKLKGGPGSFRSFEDTPSLTLNFEKFAEGQSFHGVKKLNPNNSVQDRSFLCEKISRELFNAAGVPTPRAGHAIVARVEAVLGTDNGEAAVAFRRRASAFEKRVIARSAEIERELFGAPQWTSRSTNPVPKTLERHLPALRSHLLQ